MRVVILLLAVTMLSGCGQIKRIYTGITGEASEYCYKGIVYLQLTSGAALAVDADGKPLKCN